MQETTSLADVHELLCAELNRLIDTPKDAIADECERAKAVSCIGTTIISNSRTILDAARMQSQVAIRMPKILVEPQSYERID